jgi:hypothetical protein
MFIKAQYITTQVGQPERNKENKRETSKNISVNDFTLSFAGKSVEKTQRYTERDLFEITRLRNRGKIEKSNKALHDFYTKELVLLIKEYLYPDQNLALALKSERVMDDNTESLQIEAINKIYTISKLNNIDSLQIKIPYDQVINKIKSDIKKPPPLTMQDINVIGTALSLLIENYAKLLPYQQKEIKKIGESLSQDSTLADYYSVILEDLPKLQTYFSRPEVQEIQRNEANILNSARVIRSEATHYFKNKAVLLVENLKKINSQDIPQIQKEPYLISHLTESKKFFTQAINKQAYEGQISEEYLSLLAIVTRQTDSPSVLIPLVEILGILFPVMEKPHQEKVKDIIYDITKKNEYESLKSITQQLEYSNLAGIDKDFDAIHKEVTSRINILNEQEIKPRLLKVCEIARGDLIRVIENEEPVQKLDKILDNAISALEEAAQDNIDIKMDYRKYIPLIQGILKLVAKQESEKTTSKSADNMAQKANYYIWRIYKNIDPEGKQAIEDLYFDTLKDSDCQSLKFIAEHFFAHVSESKDKDFNKLRQIVRKLDATEDSNSERYTQLRAEMINQEALILFQEISQPDKYLERAIQMYAFDKVPGDREEARHKLVSIAAHAIGGAFSWAESLGIEIKTLDPDRTISTLEEIYKKSNDDKTSTRIMNALSDYYPLVSKEHQPRIESIMLEAMRTNPARGVQNNVMTFFNNIDDKEQSPAYRKLVDLLYSNYHNAPEADKELLLINQIKLNSPHAEGLVRNILRNEPDNAHVKKIGVWGAGIYKNKNNLNLLLKLKNKLFNPLKLETEDFDRRLKELLLYSLSQYEDKRVEKTLKEISQSTDSFSDLAEALLEKNKAKAVKYEDYFIRQQLIHLRDDHRYLSEADSYKEMRNSFVPGYQKLTIEEKNWIDNTLIPFRSILAETVKEYKKFEIIEDVPTGLNTRSRAKRHGYGFFYDLSGALGGTNITIPRKIFSVPTQNANVFAHEWGHNVHHYLIKNDPEKAKQIEKLYEQAKTGKYFMDYYAAHNVKEYFAQANEAYSSVYKPFNSIINQDNYEYNHVNTRNKLKQKDPQMYAFIEALYEEYGRKNLTQSINLVA